MHTFEFRVILADLPEMTIDATNRLFEAGCDDGSPGSSCQVSHVDFHRRAPSLQEAITSAIQNVEKAGFRVQRVETEETATVDAINQQLGV